MANQKKIKLQGFKFQPFSKKQLKVLTFWQENSPVNDKFICIADGAIRSGKEQPLDALLFTPSGVKTMGDIQVGDFVFDKNGNPTKVLGIFPQGEKDVYRITFNDGSSCECGLEHLWTYTTKKCIENKNYTMFTSTLKEIKEDLERFSDRDKLHERAGKYRFPINGCVQFEEREVAIDPYLLGLLLGDGCFSHRNNGVTFSNNDYELHDYINSVVPKYEMEYRYTPRNEKHCAYGRICKAPNSSSNKCNLRLLLDSYNLLGKKSDTKFVPEDYKFNSIDVRLKILAGLLNTDGSVRNNRASIHYYSVSRRLCDDAIFLARSLGMRVISDTKPDTRNKNVCYSCCIRVNEQLYELLLPKHKNKLNLNPVKDEVWKLIKSIEFVGKKECQCIYVDNEEHLYLTDDFIVTHNTVVMVLSFVLFVMNNFNQMNAAMCGKSVGSFRRNVLTTLKQMMLALNYEVIEHRSENYIEIIKDDVVNYFYIFGGKLYLCHPIRET